MKLSTFEKDNIIAIGPFTDAFYDTLQELKSKQTFKDFIQTAYLAYDFISIQDYYQNKHSIYFHEDITDLEVKKIGSTYSRALKRFYKEDNATLLLNTLLKKKLIISYSIFANHSAQYRSKFYVIKDTTPRNKWIIISDSAEMTTAKKAILKINTKKVNKASESLNVQGFDFTAVVEALRHSTDPNYKELYTRIQLEGIASLFAHKVVRTNYSNYNLLGNLKKDIRKLISHEQDVVELDLTAAFPGILPNYILNFLNTFDQQYSSKLDRINLQQPDKYKINIKNLEEETIKYKDNCSDIYLHIQEYINNTFHLDFDRTEIKKAYLVFLFADPKTEGKRPPISTYIKKYVKNNYPEIYNSLLCIKNLITYNTVAIQIQNVMANVMKDTIKLFQKTNKETPYIPIYDCFITTKDNQQLMYHSMKDTLKKYDLEHIKIKTKNLTEENKKENVLNGLTPFDYSTSFRTLCNPVKVQNNNQEQVKEPNKEIDHQSGVPNILRRQVLPSRYKIDKVRDKIGFERLYWHYMTEKSRYKLV